MNNPDPAGLSEYYKAAESWAEDRAEDSAHNLRNAWRVAGAAGVVALLEGIALVVLMPLKQVEPYAVLVDKQTGYVQALNLSQTETITPDQALTRSMLAQYVIAREGFDIGALKDNYRKVALWSAGDARNQYVNAMQASNPSSPLAVLPRQAVLRAEIRSISNLGPDMVLVRFAVTRTDPGGQPLQQGIWAAEIRYRFSAAGMSAASRLDNPLGFQVLRYSKNAEIAPDAGSIGAAPVAAVQQPPVQYVGPPSAVASPSALPPQ